MLNTILGYPAIFIKDGKRRILVFSDLHVGWEASLAHQGLHIPSQTNRIFNRLNKIIKLTRPNTLLILGDIKHTINRTIIEEWRDVPDLLNRFQELVQEILILPGNHDGSIESLTVKNVKVLPVTGFSIKDTGFIHGHSWFSADLLKCRRLLIGHIHPIINLKLDGGKLSSQQVWLKIKINPIKLAEYFLKYMRIKIKVDVESTLKEKYGIGAKLSQIIVMPSFNDLLGGYRINNLINTSLNSKIYRSPILKPSFIDFNETEVFLLDGSYLGRLCDCVCEKGM